MNNGKTIRDAMRQMKKQATKVNPYKGDIDYVSKMGYRDDSPFNNRPYIDIYTPSGMIDMSSTGIPLIANGMYLPPYSGMYQFEPGIVREQRIPMAQKGQQVEDNDSWLENIAEIIDPTGISSWDDVYRAYKNTGLSGETALEVLGAIPLLGKVFKVTKPGIHLIKYSGIDQILRNTLPTNKYLSRFANVASKTGRGTDTVQAVLGAKDNSGFTWDMRHGEVPKFGGRNIFPQIDLGEHGDFAYGGDPSLPNIEGHYPFGGMYSKTHTHMKEGGWLDELDEEYRRGGSVNPLMRSRSKRSTTKKNIQSSINKIFLRNYDLFGPGGKNIYDPKSKYQQGGDWLDNLD